MRSLWCLTRGTWSYKILPYYPFHCIPWICFFDFIIEMLVLLFDFFRGLFTRSGAFLDSCEFVYVLGFLVLLICSIHILLCSDRTQGIILNFLLFVETWFMSYIYDLCHIHIYMRKLHGLLRKMHILQYLDVIFWRCSLCPFNWYHLIHVSLFLLG